MGEGRQSQSESYPIPWIATYLITAAVLMFAAFGAYVFLDRPSSEFDYANPDMQFLEAIVLSPDPRRGDFSELNKGDWQALCLVGHNGDVKAASARASLSGDLTKTISAAAALAKEDVRESQFLLLYVNETGDAVSVRHPHGFAFAGSNTAHCTTHKSAIVQLPVRG